jgi:flagellar basal-body rod modification protein FlgD
MQITGDNSYQYLAQGTTTTSGTTTAEEAGGELGKNEFLELLATQLQYQDPLNPMDNTQFISEMANFSSLEQMQNLNETMENYTNSVGSLQSLNLLGLNVKAERIITDGSGNTQIHELTGIVEKVDMSKSDPVLTTTEGIDIKLSEVIESSIPLISE